MKEYLGVDVGGTKMAGVVLKEDEATTAEAQTQTPRDDYQTFLQTLVGLIENLDDGRTLPVGIGMPGALSLENKTVKNSNIPCVLGKPLLQDLEHRLKRPVKIENDANCFALSEAVDGAARDAAVVFGVILGTGTGGGLVVAQRLLVGPNRIAGEWGHNSLPFATPQELPGRSCYCGKVGCIETYLSGPGLAGDHHLETGVRLQAWEIHEAAQKGHVEAQRTLDRHVQRVAKSLAALINVLDPDAIVLGGGLSQMPHLYREVPKYWGEYIYSDTVRTRLLPNRHGPSSGVRGAAWLWK